MKQAMKDRIRALLGFFGVVVAPGSRWDWRLTPRFFVFVGAAFVFFLVANVGLIKYSENPNFCNSCHIMEPYYKAWKSSKHKGVACVECHYAPAENVSELKQLFYKKYQNLSQVAKYVTRTYNSKPFAEVEDASCLRSGCHSTRLLEGRVVASAGVKFDHRPHLSDKRRGRQLRCTSCHAQMVMGNHMEVTYDTCVLCHFKDRGEGRDLKPIGGCTGCHEVPSKLIKIGNMTYNHREFVTGRGVSCMNCHMDIVSGKGEATKDRCFTCHNDQEKLGKFEDVPFVHEQHVTKKNVACFHCHQEMRHGFSDAGQTILKGPGEGSVKGAEPPAGHAPSVKFECSICHSGKHDAPLTMYSGQAAKRMGLPELPSPMFLADVDCAGCHYEPTAKQDDPKGFTTKASHEACVKCHGPKFKGIFEEGAVEMSDVLSKLSAKQEAAAKLSASGAAKTGAELAFLKAARGEHNIYLASSMVTKLDSELDALITKAGGTPEDLSAVPLISGSYCATMCHAGLGVEVPRKTVRYKGKKMPHALHIESVGGCRNCHDIAGHKRVPLKAGVKKEVCANCHDPVP